MSAGEAEKKQKDYLFTNQLETKVYSKPKGEDGHSFWDWEAYAIDLESGELREKIPW